MTGVNLRHIVSTYVNFMMYSSIQLLYANNFFKVCLECDSELRVIYQEHQTRVYLLKNVSLIACFVSSRILCEGKM
jgi:hypothetical protein